MIVFKPYSSIKDFLQRFTILKIGKLHIRLHKIVDIDRTTLYHNHPFNYISVILKGGYTESVISNQTNEIKTYKHGLLDIILRKNNIFHRIVKIKGKTLTLFIAYGKYDWNAFNTINDNSQDGIFQREINNKLVWSKKENGIWFIGNKDKNMAQKETRHSIHQCGF